MASETITQNDLKAILDEILPQPQTGTIISATATVNITSTNVDTYAEGASITLSPGSYIVMAYGGFASNTTETNRRINLYNKTSDTTLITVSNWDRWWVAHTVTMPVVLTEQATIAVRLSAGVALSNCTTTIIAMKIA